MNPRFTDLLAASLPLLGDQSLTEETRLREAGMDSMQAVELLFGIEEEFGVSLPDEALDETVFATAGSLWDAVRTAMDTNAPA